MSDNENTNWRKPKQIEVPKEVSDFLLDIIHQHKNELNNEYADQLTDNRFKKEGFDVNGEFGEIEDGKIFLVLKGIKWSKESTRST